MPAEYVCDFNDADVAALSALCDELKAGNELLRLVMGSSKIFERATSLLWVASKVERASEALFAWLPSGAASLPAAEVQNCSGGEGPLSDLMKGILVAAELAERHGEEASAVRFVLNGMRSVADRLNAFLKDEARLRILPPVGLRLRQIRQIRAGYQAIESQGRPSNADLALATKSEAAA